MWTKNAGYRRAGPDLHGLQDERFTAPRSLDFVDGFSPPLTHVRLYGERHAATPHVRVNWDPVVAILSQANCYAKACKETATTGES